MTPPGGSVSVRQAISTAPGHVLKGGGRVPAAGRTNYLPRNGKAAAKRPAIQRRTKVLQQATGGPTRYAGVGPVGLHVLVRRSGGLPCERANRRAATQTTPSSSAAGRWGMLSSRARVSVAGCVEGLNVGSC